MSDVKKSESWGLTWISGEIKVNASSSTRDMIYISIGDRSDKSFGMAYKQFQDLAACIEEAITDLPEKGIKL